MWLICDSFCLLLTYNDGIACILLCLTSRICSIFTVSLHFKGKMSRKSLQKKPLILYKQDGAFTIICIILYNVFDFKVRPSDM